MRTVDILIIGGGAAGIAAAKSAWAAGCRRIAVADRKKALGGVLLQCLHRGFGQEQNGPEYTQNLLQDFPDGILFLENTTVLSVTKEKTARLSGGREIRFDQLILATGCRETPIGALPVGGTRPKGIYTAGQMQERMNLYGCIPEGPVVILGSGDLGLVMANHLAQAGLAVTLVEQKAAIGGMARNRKCLETYPIRTVLNGTVTEVLGEKELEGCVLSTGERIACKTLLTAVGLIPDRVLVRELDNPDWLQLCGNCSRVHPMVEAVVNEGKLAGITAWERIRGKI